MRTRISIKGHSIHQMLIPFPIAFLTGGFLFNTTGYFLNRGDLWVTGSYLVLAGILSGVITAIPGLLDFIYSVPPKSSGKKRGLKHMIMMVVTILLFLLSFIIREDIVARPTLLTMGIELCGLITIMIGGWLGGTLVSRNFIGTDHRYANSGKWKEQVISSDNNNFEVDGSDLRENQMKLLHLNGKRIVLCKTEEGYFAFADHCTHRGGSLADGVLICSTVQCLWHGSQFNIKSGEVKSGPAKDKINTYNITESNGKLFIHL